MTSTTPPTTAASTTFEQQLQNYLDAFLNHARHELKGWFNLEALALSNVALATFYFLYKAIDGNESKPAGTPADDYLLIIPDAALAEGAVQGALLGALLGKYRANYMSSEADEATRPYAVGDVLVKPQQNGEYKWFRVEQVDTQGQILQRRSAGLHQGPAVHNPPIFIGPVRNAMRLLPMQQARYFELGDNYPSPRLRDNLTTAIQQIRRYLGDVPLVSKYRHRMGVVCASNTSHFVAETHPMPLRDWSIQHNSSMLLPLEPMAETARSYQHLVQNVFAQRGAYNQVEELLVFDTRQYCDGNGRFAQLLQDRNQGYYRNLVLVGSRAPYVQAGQEPCRFRRWEWTPEELALMLGQPLRYPQVELIKDDSLRCLHENALLTWQSLATQHGLDLRPLPRLLPLLYRLVLPPAEDAQSEISRQAGGLRLWAEALLASESVFSKALLYNPTIIAAVTALIGEALTNVAQRLTVCNAKLEWLRKLLADSSPNPAPIVLLVHRREVLFTEAALNTALSPQERQQLRVIDGSRLQQHLQNPDINHPAALWIVPSLQLGDRNFGELSVYRQLLLVRASVRLLAYDGIDAPRFAQMGELHRRLVVQALAHPDRQWFVGPELVAPLLDDFPEQEVSTSPSTPADSVLFAESLPKYEGVDAVFGEAGNGQLKVVAEAENKDGVDDDWAHRTSLREQQCELYFTDGSTLIAAYSRALDVPLLTPSGPLLGQRLPGTLLPGDVILTLKPKRTRLLSHLKRQEPAKFKAVDDAVDCWMEALNKLYHRYGCRLEALHAKLKDHGLRLQVVTLQRWLQGDTETKFPRRAANLRAIAKLETAVFGAEALLHSKLAHVLVQRRVYNAALRQVAYNSQLLLFDAYLSGDPQYARQGLGPELFEALYTDVQARTLQRLQLLK